MRTSTLPTVLELVSLGRSVLTTVPSIVTAAKQRDGISWSLAGASVAGVVDQVARISRRSRPPS